MNEMVKIEGKEIQRIVYQDKPVVTLPQIDMLHERPEGTARRNFNLHKDKLIEGEDYFLVPYKEWSNGLVERNSSDQKGGHTGPMTMLTESGYLMLVKSFTDDLAWKVQRALVSIYFAAKRQAQGGSETPPPMDMITRRSMAITLRQLARETLVPKEHRVTLLAKAAEYLDPAASFTQYLPIVEMKHVDYEPPSELCKQVPCSSLAFGQALKAIYMHGSQDGAREWSVEIWNKSQHSSRQVTSYLYDPEIADLVRDYLAEHKPHLIQSEAE